MLGLPPAPGNPSRRTTSATGRCGIYTRALGRVGEPIVRNSIVVGQVGLEFRGARLVVHKPVENRLDHRPISPVIADLGIERRQVVVEGNYGSPTLLASVPTAPVPRSAAREPPQAAESPDFHHQDWLRGLSAAAAKRHSSREQSQRHAGGFHGLHDLGDISGKHEPGHEHRQRRAALTYNRDRSWPITLVTKPTRRGQRGCDWTSWTSRYGSLNVTQAACDLLHTKGQNTQVPPRGNRHPTAVLRRLLLAVWIRPVAFMVRCAYAKKSIPRLLI